MNKQNKINQYETETIQYRSSNYPYLCILNNCLPTKYLTYYPCLIKLITVSGLSQWEQGYFNIQTMKPYELKQSILDNLEIEVLIERIKKQEIEIAIRDLQIKALKEYLEYEKQLTLIAKINNI